MSKELREKNCLSIEEIKDFKKRNHIDWVGCSDLAIFNALQFDNGCFGMAYYSDRFDADIPLVTDTFDVIQVEDWNKWYFLYYLTYDIDGSPKLIAFTFGDIIDGCDHYYYPNTIVKFAIENNLKIDAVSYIAICKMFMEDTESFVIPENRLPSRDDLEKVLSFNDSIMRCFYIHSAYDDLSVYKYTKASK